MSYGWCLGKGFHRLRPEPQLQLLSHKTTYNRPLRAQGHGAQIAGCWTLRSALDAVEHYAQPDMMNNERG
jgi:hypothetical protein